MSFPLLWAVGIPRCFAILFNSAPGSPPALAWAPHFSRPLSSMVHSKLSTFGRPSESILNGTMIKYIDNLGKFKSIWFLNCPCRPQIKNQIFEVQRHYTFYIKDPLNLIFEDFWGFFSTSRQPLRGMWNIFLHSEKTGSPAIGCWRILIKGDENTGSSTRLLVSNPLSTLPAYIY